MTVSVTYVDVQEDSNKCMNILHKSYSGLSDAYLPKVGDLITVYSTIHHEQYQYNVKEIMVSVAELDDHFDILLDKID